MERIFESVLVRTIIAGKLLKCNILQYFYGRYVGIVCFLALPNAPRVVIFLEFGAYPNLHLTRIDTTKKQRASRPHTTNPMVRIPT